MFISSTTYTARTGVLEFPFTYACARCGTQAAALVRAEGIGKAVRLYGVGDGAGAARQSAARLAEVAATRAINAAACPACGALQPALVGEYERAQTTLTKRRKLRVPLALGVALLAFGLLAYPAVRDMKYSSGLLFVAVGLALGFGGFVLAVASRRHPVTVPNTGSVWFWWNVPSQEPAYRAGPPQPAWLPPPPPAHVPRVDQPTGAPLVLGLVSTLVGGVMAFGGLIAWAASSETVYVANAEPGGAALTVRVDGEELARVGASAKSGDDIGWDRVTIRHGALRSLDIASASGKSWHYSLDPKKGSVLVAPEGKKNGLCLVGSKLVYRASSTIKDDDLQDEVLNDTNDGPIVLPRTYDYLFREGPKTITLDKNSSSATKWELRALDCAKFADEDFVGFRAAAAPVTAAVAPKRK